MMALILESTIDVSLVVIVGLAAAALLRRRSAAMRHCVLAAAVLCAAATPLVARAVPAWGLPAAVLTVPIERPAGIARAVAAPTPVAQSSASATTSPWRVGPQALAAIWIAGAVVGLSVLLTGFARLTWLASRSRTIATGPWVDLAADVAREHGMRRPVALLQSDHPALLVTWGLVRPKVMLPASALDWSRDRIRIVLRHELAHVRRHDWLLQLVAEGLRSVYWFNPLVWIACRRLRDESEHACDDAVLNLGVEGAGYAEHLLDLARSFRSARRTWSSAPAIAHPSNLEKRITAMLHTRNRAPLTFRSGALSVAALVAATIAIAGFGATAQTPVAFSGSVVDPHAVAAPGAAIVLTHAETNVAYTAETDKTGHFELTGLPPGSYTLRVRMPGFKEVRESLTLAGGVDAQKRITLTLGTVQETVVVADEVVSPRDIEVTVNKSRTEQFLDMFRGRPLQPPLKLTHESPVFPSSLSGKGWKGKVVVTGRIGTDGTMNDLAVVESDHPDAARAALDAVKLWRFEPTRLHGTPTDTSITVTVNFGR